MDFAYRFVDELPAETIVALYQAGGWWKESPAWRAALPGMVRGSFAFLVASLPDGRVVGMGRAISDGASDAYIQDVVVLEAFRGKGVGGELVARLARHCRDRGIGWICLVAEPGTAPFYERLGFSPLAGFQPMLYGTRD